MVLVTDTTRMTVRRRTSQASVGLLVLGLHLAGMLAWWTAGQHSMRMDHGEARLPSISVWLLPALAKPEAVQARRPLSAQDPAYPSRQRGANKSVETSRTTEAATAPDASGVSLPSEPSGPTEAQAPPSPALNLNLSRKDISSAAPRSFAEQSPFRGRLPKTVERQIASAAAETGPWTEERVDNDHIRFRRGNTCVMMQRPRAASIDPFSEAAGRIPWRSSKPQECND
jgi:hypothetical protein